MGSCFPNTIRGKRCTLGGDGQQNVTLCLAVCPIFILLTLILTEKLSSPLRKLAMYSVGLKEKGGLSEEVDIPTWYYEAKQLTETIQEYAKKQEQTVKNFKERSYTDPLTGLRNRRYGEKVIESWTIAKQQFSMIMIDIDHFKSVNDTYGHQVGDDVLKFLAGKMNRSRSGR